MRFDSYLFTSAGGRSENQDSAGKQELENAALYIVADGLGGHRLGNLASSVVVDEMMSFWKYSRIQSKEQMRTGIKEANDAVLELQKEKYCSAKSTVALVAIQGEKALWANVGDSRVYYLCQDRIAAATEDHSVAYKKYKAGEISKEEIAWDEDQSSLLRALGNETRWEPNIYELEPIKTGSAFLLCSDGFWEYITEDEIVNDYKATKTSLEWGKIMLTRVESRFKPGHDNFSFITVKIE